MSGLLTMNLLMSSVRSRNINQRSAGNFAKWEVNCGARKESAKKECRIFLMVSSLRASLPGGRSMPQHFRSCPTAAFSR